LFKIDIPENAENLKITASNGAGGRKIYWTYGSPLKDEETGNIISQGESITDLDGNASCTIPDPQKGIYYFALGLGQNLEGYENVTLVASYNVDGGSPLLTIKPDDFMDYGQVTINNSNENTFTLQNTGSLSLDISDIKISGNNANQFEITSPLTTNFKIVSGASVEVKVRFSPSSAGSKSAQLEISNNSDNASPIKSISMWGTGTEALTKTLVTSPESSWDHGNVTINNSSDKTFILQNTGSTSLNVSGIKINGTNSEQFEIVEPSSTSFDIASKTTVEVKVRFSPSSTGSKSAHLEISNNSDNTSPTKSISLWGTGTDGSTKTLEVSPVYSCDFGVATQNSTVSKTIFLKNSGTEIITISRLEISGTNANQFHITSSASGSFQIPANATQEVIIQFTPSSEGGKSALLSIHNDSENESPVKIISLTGAGTPEPTKTLDISPAYSSDFGIVTQGSSVSKLVVLKNTGTDAMNVSKMEITGVNAEQFIITSSANDAFQIPPGGSQEVTIQFIPDSDGGKTASLRIENDSENEGPAKMISLIGTGTQILTKTLSVSPINSCEFGLVTQNTPASKTIVLENAGSDAITIVSMVLNGTNADQFMIANSPNGSFQIPVGGIQEVTIQFTPDSEGGKVASISIQNDSENASPVKVISLSGTGTPDPTRTLKVSPTYSCDFGAVDQNSSVTKTIILENSGTDEITVSELDITGVDANRFSVVSPVSPSFTIPAKGSKEIAVQFTPESESSKYATLRIANNSDNEKPLKIILLSGRGQNLTSNYVYDLNELTIYPNPTTGVINLEGLSVEKETILSVYNMKGQLITQKVAIEHKAGVDLSQQSPGIYLLVIKNDRTQTFKIIKE
jgi:hypothetical protein